MPNKNTFIINQKLIIDPFANNNKEFATITNDLNPNFNTDYHLPALDFLKELILHKRDIFKYILENKLGSVPLDDLIKIKKNGERKMQKKQN